MHKKLLKSVRIYPPMGYWKFIPQSAYKMKLQNVYIQNFPGTTTKRNLSTLPKP